MAKDDAKRDLGLGADSIEELRYIQQVYQQQYSVATNSINMLLQELQELNAEQNTLEHVDLLDGKEMLTSIGPDSFLFAKAQSTKTALMSIGAGYLIEKDIDSAKTRISMLIQRRTDNLNKMMKNRKELESALIEISYRLGSVR